MIKQLYIVHKCYVAFYFPIVFSNISLLFTVSLWLKFLIEKFYTCYYMLKTEAGAQRYSVKKVFEGFCRIQRKTPVPESLSHLCQRLWQEHLFLQNTSGGCFCKNIDVHTSSVTYMWWLEKPSSRYDVNFIFSPWDIYPIKTFPLKFQAIWTIPW